MASLRTFSRLARPVRPSVSLRPAASLSPASSISCQKRLHSQKHPKGFTPPSQEELDELRERVHDFTRREIPEELAAKTDKTNAFPMEMWEKLGEAGFLGVTADEDYGGLGMGYQAHCIVLEEMSRASGSIALSYAAHSQLCINQISLNGTPEQKEKYLPGLIAGTSVGALAMSESGSGSDVGIIRTEDCAGAILYAAERATECTLDCIQLLGGMGYTEEMPASRLLRDAKLYEIGAGTSEIRRMVIGRAFNKQYANA
ncbi:acyl-CoA dehydrogenase NM domain-like protein [Trichoderma citrinoviride]|uniref:Acyl-CoA dehydrogenase NM domain-like protein n=1 Tax=Trichoderma citrinoviride TaxID=58853 RepID=A0A2T4BGA0_9HYPO|nr:acyl-CoA dehydrogenase NM domain-like protein [Trichoderma citrinoviride]PTB68356.1 acyl-CoA dehydrogenase NM domain-like protein [Trichoderma citrinoviride]